MALGATTGVVQRQVLASTLRLAFAGVALGTVAAILVSKVIAALLLGTCPRMSE